jgi:hypothetical protein
LIDVSPAPGVAVIEGDGVVYVASLPDGPIVVLEGVAAAIWVEACAQGRPGLSERVAARLDPPVDGIAQEVDDFVARLIESGLLVATSL